MHVESPISSSAQTERPQPVGEVVSHHLYGVLRTRATAALQSPPDLLRVLRKAVDEVGLTAVGELGVALSPYGASVVVLLTESHVAMHHWPELETLTVDIHVCDFGRNNLDRARAVAELLDCAFARPGFGTTWHCDTISG
ncbi:MAG: S-adenosylmethionine decarboxylase [Actinomycetota bacterium]|nr:S-adenosylmethionine decarboxylase [Actinomycetota bacterium]